MDEPEPMGENSGPNAGKVLAAAIGNCLTASLLFCLQKAMASSRISASSARSSSRAYL